jgi:hypothetical protein
MKLVLLIQVSLLIIAGKCFGTNERNQQMQMRMRMKDVRSTSDFIHTMIQDRPASGIVLQPMERQMFQTHGNTQQGFYQQGVEIMASMIATPDVCEPRPTTVAIPPDTDPRIVYWPTCTQVPRCGGCCGLDLLECTPLEVEPINVLVMKQRISANDSSRYEYLGNVNIVLEKHLRCDCHCRTKQSDCNAATQDYDEASCSCRCRNSHDATSCPAPKRWDEKHCRCVCPVLVNCLDDEYFDFNSCSCIRRSPVAASASISSDPCANQTCRSGYRSVLVNNVCQCRRSKRSV